jgi:CRP-like cAMP-binding protein
MSDSVTSSGIRTRTYKSQAIVYFEGDKSEGIFILKKGKVILTYFKPESGEEIKEEVRPGEFFGVKSALGKYPREETAQTFGETTILILSLADFERLVLANVAIVKKMLRVFSNQLRRIGKAVREVMGETNSVDPASELFKIADHYARNAQYEPALYAFKKYMEYYPDGRNASAAMGSIRSIESGQYVPQNVSGTVSSDPGPPPSFGNDFDMSEPEDDFGMDFGDSAEEPMEDFGMGSYGDDSDATSDLTDEMDDFISSDISDDIVEDFSFGGEDDPKEKLEQAIAYSETGDYSQAISLLEQIKENPGADDDLKHKAVIEIGKNKKNQNMLQEALTEFSLFIKNNPKSPYVKEALLEAGNVYLEAGNTEKGTAYLKKVAAMPPRNEINQKALSLLKQYTFD